MTQDDSSKQSITQLSMFEIVPDIIHPMNDDTERPLPLLTADKWGFPLAYIDVDGNQDNYLYACQDWYAGLNSKPGRWAKLKKELVNSNHKFSITSAPYTIPDGRTYQTDYTNAKGLYIMASNMRSTKQRPSLDEIKQYLADAGVILDMLRRDPARARELEAALYRKQGKSDKWISQRMEGKEKRNAMTEAARDTHIDRAPDYALLTNITYEVVLGAVKSALVARMGLNGAQARNFRDHISRLALQALTVAEDAAEYKMREWGRDLTTDEQAVIVQDAAEFVAPRFSEIAEYLGVDLLTGQKKLVSGQV